MSQVCYTEVDLDDIRDVIDESEKVSLGGTFDEQISEWVDTLDP